MESHGRVPIREHFFHCVPPQISISYLFMFFSEVPCFACWPREVSDLESEHSHAGEGICNLLQVLL